MKRILQAVGIAAIVAVPHAAPALDAGLTLDRFPSAGPAAVSSSREWGGDRYDRRTDAVRDYRAGSYHRRRGSFHDRRDGSYRNTWRDNGRYRSSGSLVDLRTYGGAVERGSFYGTAGTANSSIIVIGAPETFGSLAPITDGGLRGGAKILDVQADRLDRKPYGKNGLHVSYNGTSKIIRISPDFRRGHDQEREDRMASEPVPTPYAELSPQERAVTVYPDPDLAERPVDPPAPRVAESAPAAPETPAAPPAAPEATSFLEPWTPEWLRDCVARYPNFDASLGTYTTDDGQRRFCTGER